MIRLVYLIYRKQSYETKVIQVEKGIVYKNHILFAITDQRNLTLYQTIDYTNIVYLKLENFCIQVLLLKSVFVKNIFLGLSTFPSKGLLILF